MLPKHAPQDFGKMCSQKDKSQAQPSKKIGQVYAPNQFFLLKMSLHVFLPCSFLLPVRSLVLYLSLSLSLSLSLALSIFLLLWAACLVELEDEEEGELQSRDLLKQRGSETRRGIEREA